VRLTDGTHTVSAEVACRRVANHPGTGFITHDGLAAGSPKNPRAAGYADSTSRRRRTTSGGVAPGPSIR
jgi:hypothetical protein